jgi:hypothetical protein
MSLPSSYQMMTSLKPNATSMLFSPLSWNETWTEDPKWYHLSFICWANQWKNAKPFAEKIYFLCQSSWLKWLWQNDWRYWDGSSTQGNSNLHCLSRNTELGCKWSMNSYQRNESQT